MSSTFFWLMSNLLLSVHGGQYIVELLLIDAGLLKIGGRISACLRRETMIAELAQSPEEALPEGLDGGVAVAALAVGPSHHEAPTEDMSVDVEQIPALRSRA